MESCAYCRSKDLEIDETPPWNAPFTHRKKITFHAKCLGCNKRLQREMTFNDLDEYIQFQRKLGVKHT